MKKIGIMSMQRVCNYGSFLQAYGLSKTIKELGDYEIEFVDFRPGEKIIKDNKSKSFFKRIMKNINIYSFLKRKKIEHKFLEEFQDSLFEILNIKDEKNYYPDDIDELIIGSDEVFNCMQANQIGFSKDLFGFGYESIPVISYAACFGHTTLENIKDFKIDNDISEMLNKFKSISVRDENSFNIVKSLIKKEISLNLDPVLIADFDDILNGDVSIKNYILIYAYPGRLSKEEEKYIKKFAKKHSKKIISLGVYQKIADYIIMVKPLEIFKYFKNADFVITDTFHGSIFSIKTKTKFCTIIRKSNRNKLYDLLNRLEQTNQTVNNIEDIDKIYENEIEFSKTYSIIEKEREKSLLYLKGKFGKINEKYRFILL